MAQSLPTEPTQAAGIPGFPGPFAVGRYAAGLRERIRQFASVCVIGEVTGARVGRGPNVYFELRDADGALPCVMWRDEFDRLDLDEGDLRDGVEVVAAGGLEYYPGSASSSPRLSFRATRLRLAGEGDLLARLARLRRQLLQEGVFEPQKRLARPLLPRRIGVVTAELGAARRDLLAALERRAWRGTIVWGYAPVQDRRAAPAIAAQIRELAAIGEVETIVVTRGGGSIADLWAFCDETLCRTVALTPVPVISAVGHEVDRTLLDDVAAVCCSTPTHAAEAAVGVDCSAARARLAVAASRLDAAGRLAVVGRARSLVARSRAPLEHVARHRRGLHQSAREIRASFNRGTEHRWEHQRRVALVLGRKADATTATLSAEARRRGQGAAALTGASEAIDRRVRELSDQTTALAGARGRLLSRRAESLGAWATQLRTLDPERTLERGYALVLDGDGEPLARRADVISAGRFAVRLADGSVRAVVDEGGRRDGR